MRPEQPPVDEYALEAYRPYLRLMASQQLADRFRGKVDPSGVVQETLWEAHQQLAQGRRVPEGKRLAWLRRILANNLADEVRRYAAAKRDLGREVSIQNAVDRSSQRLEQWLAHDLQPSGLAEQEDQLLALAAAITALPGDQREALLLHYWSGSTLMEIANRLGRSREAVAGLIKRGLQRLRSEFGTSKAPVRCISSGGDQKAQSAEVR
jgi:RNA polymerase sigma-70 factor (ECF subfamily)